MMNEYRFVRPGVRTLLLFGIVVVALALGVTMIRAQSPASAFLGLLPAMTAMDADGDGELSSAEVGNAPNALVSLDADEDGMLSADELAPEIGAFGRGFRGGRAGPGGGFGAAGILDTLPVMASLDADGDGELSAEEIADASAALRPLDADGDGTLGGDELVPAGGFGRGRGGRGGFAGRRGRGGRGGFGRGRAGADPNAEPLEPGEVDFEDGADTIPDRETFKALAYQGAETLIDTHLIGQEFVKFVVTGAGTDEAKIYFMNTKTHRAHGAFLQAAGLGGRRGSGSMMGVLIYRPLLTSPSGQPLYTFEFEPNDSFPFDMIQVADRLLSEYAPPVRGNLAYHPLSAAVPRYEDERELYESAALPVFLEEDLFADIGFLPLHPAEGYGRLRLMALDERPGVRDVVLYRSVPNEMPRVAGIITGFRQTPLSHVNLRAVQDDVPNAYIKGAVQDPTIAGLIDKYVYYRVAPDGYEIREASLEEVENHFAEVRPSEPQVPVRDLSVKEIRALDDIGFDDSTSVGVKAANVATLDKIGFPDYVVPNGFAIPFYFYDEFMEYNDFYRRAVAMRETVGFHTDTELRERLLAAFRRDIGEGATPDWMMDALSSLQNGFPDGTSIRLRSSTNNEDLPGFSGAGLYDSFTHRPDEGHIASSVKQVFASLWNFRAYEEREFYRIDHFAAAMGVLAHPNYSGELANGVAVSADIVYQTGNQVGGRSYYVNTQVGENLVTNPEGESIPEEMLLSPMNARNDRLVRSSNRVADGETLLHARHRTQLRRHLTMIHDAFRRLYGLSRDDRFAIEIEFKITADGGLAIKQARPWVY